MVDQQKYLLISRKNVHSKYDCGLNIPEKQRENKGSEILSLLRKITKDDIIEEERLQKMVSSKKKDYKG